MRRDDISMNHLYQKMYQPKEQLNEGIMDFFKRKPRIEKENESVLNAIEKTRTEIKKLGLDPDKFINKKLVDQFFGYGKPTPAIDTDIPDDKLYRTSMDASSPQQATTETKPSTPQQQTIPQSNKPKWGMASRNLPTTPEGKLDLDVYGKSKESSAERLMKKAKANAEARKKGDPIPYPEILLKKKEPVAQSQQKKTKTTIKKPKTTIKK